jgi:TolB protein
MPFKKAIAVIICLCGFFSSFAQVGIFTNNADVGTPAFKGSAVYDAKTQEYTITGGGTNLWNAKDQFHYVYRKMSGDFIVQVRSKGFAGAGLSAHRKTGWMVRKSLTTGSACVVAALHAGDSLTSLQYRKIDNDTMSEKKSTQRSPNAIPNFIQLERTGTTYTMRTAHAGQPTINDTVKNIDLGTELYVGLFVCAHDSTVTETATLDNVRMGAPGTCQYCDFASTLEELDVETGTRLVYWSSPVRWEAPNMKLDNINMILDKGSDGKLYNFSLVTKTATLINTGTTANNNDHVLSWDQKTNAISANGAFSSVVYTVPADGGAPKLITTAGISYLHGWSPDDQNLIYVGMRNGDYDIYRIPAAGGQEVRLTTAAGLDDGCEYSPDGKYI